MSREQVLACSTYNDKEIKGFFGGYRWLSNYHICDVFYEGDTYPSSENAFQAAKALWADRSLFFKCTPSEAKTFGKNVKIDNILAWDSRKVDVMRKILEDKFTRNLDLKEKLLETQGKYLEETNWWGDVFWGVCNSKGQNMLGKLLMEIRDKLLANGRS